MSDEILTVLQSIDSTLKQLLALSRQKKGVVSNQGVSVPPIADDAELDSNFGNEPVKFAPRNWTGDFVKGQKMSECSPAFLDQLASAFDSFAAKKRHEGEEQKAQYEERSARRARGWAARLRAGWTPKLPEGMTTKDEVNW